MSEFNVNKKMEQSLRANFLEAQKDPAFNKLIATLKIDKDLALKYTSSLEATCSELKNCSNCPGLFECKNKLTGHVNYPTTDYDKHLVFTYKPCKYLKASEKNLENSDKYINENARMKDIDTSDKKRAKLIKWVVDFYDHYDNNKIMKGLYLNGSFGAGKTFILSALFNELKINKRVSAEVIYFPEVLRILKDDWNLYQERMDYYQNVDLLLIDDIGAEKVTDWGRDEVLGTILQYRMNNGKTTFFTSNLSLEDLEKHLSISSNSVDTLKARRIMERIKQLTTSIELISENRRK